MSDDIFHRWSLDYIRWGGYLPDAKLVTLIRILLLFAVVTLVYYWTFITQRRKVFARVLLSVIGVGLILAFPIKLPQNEVLRAWILTLSIVVAFGLPAILPFFAVREAGRQPHLKAVLYAVLAALLLIGMIST